jgi:hypothetical protein
VEADNAKFCVVVAPAETMTLCVELRYPLADAVRLTVPAGMFDRV